MSGAPPAGPVRSVLRTIASRSFASLSSLPSLAAQTEPAPTAPPLPAPDSAAAQRLVDDAVDKMLAYGRGAFRTVEVLDHAMFRDAGMPFGPGETVVVGGWERGLVWGEWEGRSFVRGGGRTLAKVDGDWRLRRERLADGLSPPFTLDPGLLFAVWKRMPATARRVVRVDGLELRGRRVAILTVHLVGDDALRFADAGVVPDPTAGFGTPQFLFGGAGVPRPPRPEFETWIAFSVDVASGDLLRLAAKVYETNPMFVGFGGPGLAIGVAAEERDEGDEGDEGDAERAGDGGDPGWQDGLPRREPSPKESVCTYRVEFDRLGLAEPPALAPEWRALLGGR